MGNTGQTANRTVIQCVKITYVTEIAVVSHVSMHIILDLRVTRYAETAYRVAVHVMDLVRKHYCAHAVMKAGMLMGRNARLVAHTA